MEYYILHPTIFHGWAPDTITLPTSTTNIACKNQTAILFLSINVYNTRKLVLNSFILWKCGKLIRPYTFLWVNKTVLCWVQNTGSFLMSTMLSSCGWGCTATLCVWLKKQHELGLYPRLWCLQLCLCCYCSVCWSRCYFVTAVSRFSLIRCVLLKTSQLWHFMCIHNDGYTMTQAEIIGNAGDKLKTPCNLELVKGTRSVCGRSQIVMPLGLHFGPEALS